MVQVWGASPWRLMKRVIPPLSCFFSGVKRGASTQPWQLHTCYPGAVLCSQMFITDAAMRASVELYT
jgi:hypothetical protein